MRAVSMNRNEYESQMQEVLVADEGSISFFKEWRGRGYKGILSYFLNS